MKEGGRDVGALTCDWIQLYIPQHALYSSERLLVDGAISLHISIQPESLGHIKSTLLIPQPFQLNLLISPSPSPTPSILPRRGRREREGGNGQDTSEGEEANGLGPFGGPTLIHE